MLRYILYILIAGIILYILLGLLKPRTVEAPGKSYKGDSIKSFDKINYLGGNPNIKIEEVKEGILHIFKDMIVFDDRSSELFTIPIKDIKLISIETKESLYNSREYIKNPLITELKDGNIYIRIKYNDKIYSSINVVFHSYYNNDYSKNIVDEVKKRMR